MKKDMKKLIIQLSNERLITPSGLSLVGALLGKSDLVNCANRISSFDKISQVKIKTGDILLSYIGLLCQGKTEFEAIKEFQEDTEFYKYALGITSDIPSAETLRQRMDATGSSLRKEILKANVAMFQNNHIQPSPLPDGYVPVDIDVTPFDNSKSSKEGVSRTYKGYDGYAPMMAYIGTEGFLINCELREGKQHCQKHTPEFLRETLALCHQITDAPLLICLDSGNDVAVNLGILIEDVSRFVLKRNPRSGETKQDWLTKVQKSCQDIRTPREGKTVYVGSAWKEVDYTDNNGNDKSIVLRIAYEVTERTIDKHG
jgi:hypothetical protein